MMRKSIVFTFLNFLLFTIDIEAQIVQPGQLDVVIYPGSQINEEYLIGNSSNDPEIDALLYNEKTLGTLCVNKSTCYENVYYNVDLQSKMLILDIEGGEKFLSWNFVHSLSSISNSRTYKIFLDPSDNLKYFSELLFSSGEVKLYRKFYLITLKPNYRPEFDTGSKVVKIEVRDEYVFIGEDGNSSDFSKLSRSQLKRNLPKQSKVLDYIKKQKPSIKSEGDFVSVLEKIYL